MKYIFYTIFLLLVCSFNTITLAQERIKVSGTVLDGSSNNSGTIASVTIQLDGKVIGSSDRFGKYSIEVPSNATLVFKIMGYETQSIKVNKRTSIDVRLQSSENLIDAVTVTSGYQTKERALNTGSVVTISGKDIQGQPAGDVISLLQGRVAGLNIQNNTGAPGMRGTVTIRGNSNINVSGTGNESFMTPTSPLYVIDGVPVDDNTEFSYGFQQAGPGVSPASQIPPEDIEEVSVL